MLMVAEIELALACMSLKADLSDSVGDLQLVLPGTLLPHKAQKGVLIVVLKQPTACTASPQDIYIARAEGDLALEEELYWALINIYRSPAVMFELTARNFARKKQL